MLYSPTRNIDDRVVELLVEGRMTVKSICAALGEGEKVSLRGVYKAVHNLIQDEVLIKAGKWVLLSEEWARLVSTRLASPVAPAIGEGERISYTFTSLEHLDAFWKSTILPLERTVGAKELFIYNPHSFWVLLPSRKESEELFLRHFSAGQAGFLTIGGETPADREFKRAYQSEHLQIDLRPLASIRRTDHVSILGPYVVTTRLPKSTTERIDALYTSEQAQPGLSADILALYRRGGKMKIIIEHNPGKAENFRRTLARNFYFKRPE